MSLQEAVLPGERDQGVLVPQAQAGSPVRHVGLLRARRARALAAVRHPAHPHRHLAQPAPAAPALPAPVPAGPDPACRQAEAKLSQTLEPHSRGDDRDVFLPEAVPDEDTSQGRRVLDAGVLCSASCWGLHLLLRHLPLLRVCQVGADPWAGGEQRQQQGAAAVLGFDDPRGLGSVQTGPGDSRERGQTE